MYREKLISQMAVLEDMQKRCDATDVSEIIELGSNILRLAQKIDELDESSADEATLSVCIDGQKVYETVRKWNEQYTEKHKGNL